MEGLLCLFSLYVYNFVKLVILAVFVSEYFLITRIILVTFAIFVKFANFLRALFVCFFIGLNFAKFVILSYFSDICKCLTKPFA